MPVVILVLVFRHRPDLHESAIVNGAEEGWFPSDSTNNKLDSSHDTEVF
jgi:hypothetical protein